MVVSLFTIACSALSSWNSGNPSRSHKSYVACICADDDPQLRRICSWVKWALNLAFFAPAFCPLQNLPASASDGCYILASLILWILNFVRGPGLNLVPSPPPVSTLATILLTRAILRLQSLSGKLWLVSHRLPQSPSEERGFLLDVTWLRGSRELKWSVLRMEIDSKAEHERYSILPLAQFE